MPPSELPRYFRYLKEAATKELEQAEELVSAADEEPLRNGHRSGDFNRNRNHDRDRSADEEWFLLLARTRELGVSVWLSCRSVCSVCVCVVCVRGEGEGGGYWC